MIKISIMNKLKEGHNYLMKMTILLFCLMLTSLKSNSQSKVKCTDCKNGIITVIQTTRCKNCESWADSYRNIRGCDVCKNNKIINKRKHETCTTCKGTTWRLPIKPVPLTREQEIYKKIKELNLNPIRHVGTFRLNWEYTNYDIFKYKVKYDYSENNLWYLLGAIITNEYDYNREKAKVDALLDYFELMYKMARKSDGWPGDILYYPTPDEVIRIRYDLNQLSSNPNYKPNFGLYLSASDLLWLY